MSAITETAVWNALRQVEEPDLKKDLVTLNMVRNLRIEGQRVAFTVVLTTPACPLKDLIRNACVQAIKLLVSPEAEVDIEMTAEVTTSQAAARITGLRNLVAVGSGKGGVGKSTVASNLAVALARAGSRVGLLDADIYGPSVPLLFGLEGERPLLREHQGRDLMVPFNRHGVQVMSIGFLVEPGQPVVWRGPMASKAMNQLLGDTLWGELDYLILDLPPGTGDIHITIAQQFPLAGALIVTTPQAVAVADAQKALAMFTSPQINVPVLGVIENMAYFSPPDLPDRRYYLFGQGGGQLLADRFGVPLLGQLPLVEAVRESGDAGQPIALAGDSALGQAYAELAARVAQQVSIANARAALTAV